MEKEKFFILDWAGNIKFNGDKFNSFDEAYAKISEYLESTVQESEVEEMLGEYQVLPCSMVKTLI